MKKIATEQKLEARFLKIRVQDWQRGRSLKMELYGCDKGSITILSIKKLLLKTSSRTVHGLKFLDQVVQVLTVFTMLRSRAT